MSINYEHALVCVCVNTVGVYCVQCSHSQKKVLYVIARSFDCMAISVDTLTFQAALRTQTGMGLREHFDGRAIRYL